MTDDRLRAVCEHEAAHAVTAAAVGVRVVEVCVQSRARGWTLHEGASHRAAAGVITAAGDVWQRRLSALPYSDLSCDDLATFEREHGLSALWQAEHSALHILTEHRRAVEALAIRLARERHVRFT